MNPFSLSWGIDVTFPGYGGKIFQADWVMIEEKLHTILPSVGTVTLGTQDEKERSRSLQVQADNGSYIITFGVETENDWVVRTYCSPECQSSNKTVEIIGDFYVAPIIFQDKNIVIAIFKEFFYTGDVSYF